MIIQNLGKNILYRFCEELARRNGSRSMEKNFVYRHYSDIPKENIDVSLQFLVDKGFLKIDQTGRFIELTDHGWSQIQSQIQHHRRSACKL